MLEVMHSGACKFDSCSNKIIKWFKKNEMTFHPLIKMMQYNIPATGKQYGNLSCDLLVQQ